MIYDCFIFNNELELLELRLHELTSVVDRFVLVEATHTFTGQPKPAYFLRHQNKFRQFLPKLTHILVKDINQAPPATSLPYFHPEPFQAAHLSAWSREIYQRNAIKRGLKSCKTDDVILISDVDEIPNPRILSRLKPQRIPIALEQKHYYYYYNCLAENRWLSARAVRYRNLRDPQETRQAKDFKVQKRGGWHFSFLGNYRAIQQKIKSYSHQEHNTTADLSPQKIKFYLHNALDLFGRPFRYDFVKIDDSYPRYFLSHLDSYRKHIHTWAKPDSNTVKLRQELFSVSSALYWQKLENRSLSVALADYQEKYRQAVRYNPIYYLLRKIHKFRNQK